MVNKLHLLTYLLTGWPTSIFDACRQKNHLKRYQKLFVFNCYAGIDTVMLDGWKSIVKR